MLYFIFRLLIEAFLCHSGFHKSHQDSAGNCNQQSLSVLVRIRAQCFLPILVFFPISPHILLHFHCPLADNIFFKNYSQDSPLNTNSLRADTCFSSFHKYSERRLEMVLSFLCPFFGILECWVYRPVPLWSMPTISSFIPLFLTPFAQKNIAESLKFFVLCNKHALYDRCHLLYSLLRSLMD